MFSKKNLLQEIDMDFLVRFAAETRLLKSRKYFTKKDFVLGLSNALSVDECEYLLEKFREGANAKEVSVNFLLTKNPTARTITESLIRYLALERYNQIYSNIIFRELLVDNFRTDVNLINGVSYTFEIKTARDKIEKSILQTNHFKEVFEYVNLVTQDENSVPSQLNENIGVFIVKFDDGQLIFKQIKPAIKNIILNSKLQLSVLTKDELMTFYGESGKMKSRKDLIDGLLKTETEENINKRFKFFLKERFRPKWLGYAREKLFTNIE